MTIVTSKNGQKYDGRTSDLELKWLTNTYGHEWEEWRSLSAQWLAQQSSALGQRREALTLFLETYLARLKPWAASVCVFFEGYQGHRCSSEEFKEIILQNTNRTDSSNLSRMINGVVEFIDWVLVTHFSEPNDHGVQVGLWQNPFQKVKHKHKFIETVRNPLPYRYIEDLRHILCPKSSKCFRDWVWAHQCQDSDWIEVDPDLIDKNDTNCVWRTKKNQRHIQDDSQTDSIHQIWSPVRAMVIYLKLQLPLRTFQVRFLDSGEADTYRYDNEKWAENTVHSFATGNTKHPYEKGFFRRIYDSMTGSYSTGLYITTNKTADQNKNEVDRGYVIPWEHSEVLYWCQALRNWQEKYNPINQPTSCTTLLHKHTSQLKSNQQLNDMGCCCFLFRDAAAKKDDKAKPIIHGKVDVLWYQLLKALENKLFAQGTTLSNGQVLKLVCGYPDDYKGSKRATLFPLHSLRVSLITAYAMEGNIPLPVIAKLLAGHSRLITTVYYTKITPSVMASKMREAHDNLDKNEEKSLREFLMDANKEQIQQQVACVSQEGMIAALANRNPIGWVNQYIGLCLMGRNTVNPDESLSTGGCWNGGKLIKDNKYPNLRVYGPVPHHVENCVCCRWFLTDSRYLSQLEAHLNFLSYRAAEAANLALALEGEIEAINEERYTTEALCKPFGRYGELEALQRRFEKQTLEANLYTEDWIACFELIARIRKIELNRDKSDTTNKLIAVGSEDDIKICITETNSKLLQLALICDDAEYYPDLKDDVVKTAAVAERTTTISRYMKKKGYQPALLLMDEETQLVAVNAMLRQMALMMDKDNKLEGFRKAVNYLEMEQYMTDEGLLKHGLKALSACCKQPILKLANGKLIDINEDKSHVH